MCIIYIYKVLCIKIYIYIFIGVRASVLEKCTKKSRKLGRGIFLKGVGGNIKGGVTLKRGVITRSEL